MTSDNNSTATAIVKTAATLATVVAVSIPLLQSDFASRFLLSAERLQAKRQASYRYKWEWTLVKAVIKSRGGRDQDLDRESTELILKEKDIRHFIETHEELDIISIELDDLDPRATREYFIFLRDEQQHLYQLPLLAFGLQLARHMEDRLSSTTLCFIADASSGWGPHILCTVLEQSKAGVALIRQPLWMALLSQIVEKRVISTTNLQKIVFGLCRLHAWRVRDQVGTARTVIFTLPGQACTPTLAPLLQSAFPCERHLFVYDSAVRSVQRAMVWPITTTSSNNSSSLEGYAITATTPMSPFRHLKNLQEALSKLPLSMAETTETWMRSVDTFLTLKAEESTNEYLPYVLKLSLLLEDSKDRTLALTNVLQFVTGSRSRPVPEAVLDAAVESLREICQSYPELPPMQARHRTNMEHCIFLHKGILIENKTLLDTVIPKKEWSLKATKKVSGCACCGPDEEDDEEEEERLLGKVMPGTFTTRPKYVDGKAGFAFDPTQFG
jgi:hypothetical protein